MSETLVACADCGVHYGGGGFFPDGRCGPCHAFYLDENGYYQGSDEDAVH